MGEGHPSQVGLVLADASVPDSHLVWGRRVEGEELEGRGVGADEGQMRIGRRRAGKVVAMVGFLAVGTGACTGGDSPQSPAAQLTQHLLVVTEAPGDIEGQLFRMEWADTGWRQVGAPIPVVVGRGGVGPKQEGDGRSPEGVFELGPAFGYASELPPELALPYEAMASGSVCVDDPASAYYNQILDPDTLPEAGPGAKDWTSFEAMRRDLAYGDDLYKWGVVVRYNDSAVPGAGSCIFLHVWRGSESPTAGCTAMAEEDLLSLIGWMEPGLGPNPILVQGTRMRIGHRTLAFNTHAGG